MNTYIDVRGPYPILFIGLKAFPLEGQSRRITIDEALTILNLNV